MSSCRPFPTPRVSASKKAKDDEKSQLSAKDSGGKTSADSSSTLTNTNLRRSSRGSSMKKHDPLNPSPSLRKSKKLVNRNLKDNKQHSSSSACAKRSEKGSCSAGSKESGKITPSLKSNNLGGNEQIRLGETARSTRENGKKIKEMWSADSVEPTRKKRLDSRTYRKYLVALMIRSRGNETSNLEVCKDTTDDSNIRKEKDLNEMDPSRGDEDIELSSCVDIEVTNFSKELRNCSEDVNESEKELCPPSKIPLPCSSNGLGLEEEEGVEPIEMTKVVDMTTAALPNAGFISNTSSEMIAECSIAETRDACPVCDKPKSTENSTSVLQRPISYCRGECDPATLSPCQNNPLLEATFPRGNDLSELRCVIPSNVEPSESSNSGPERTNDGYILQTNRPSCSHQDDTPVLQHKLAGPTMQFSQVQPLVTTAAYASRSDMIATHERPQLFPADPLRMEVEKILHKKELSTKMTDYEKMRLDSERAREIEEVKKKYEALVQAADARMQQTHSSLDTNYRRVCLNRTFAEAYKYGCRDLKPPSQGAKGKVHTAQLGWHALHPMPSHLQTYMSSGISREAASSSPSTQLLMQMECRARRRFQT